MYTFIIEESSAFLYKPFGALFVDSEKYFIRVEKFLFFIVV